MIHEGHEVDEALINEAAKPFVVMNLHHLIAGVHEVPDHPGAAQGVQLPHRGLQHVGMKRPFPPIHEGKGVEDRRYAVTDELALQGRESDGQGKDGARPGLYLLLDPVVMDVDEPGHQEPVLALDNRRSGRHGCAPAPAFEGDDPSIPNDHRAALEHVIGSHNTHVRENGVPHDGVLHATPPTGMGVISMT